MIGNKAVESRLNIAPIISNKMMEAIDLWSKMYTDEAPWLHEATMSDPINIVSLGLPAMIASEKARTALIEMQSEITVKVDKEVTPEEENSVVPSNPRIEYMNKEYQERLLPKLRTQIEYGIAKGGLIIKPYLVLDKNPKQEQEEGNDKQNYKFAFDFIQADGFYPVSFNSSGEITECVFVQCKQDKNTVYTRLEHHKLENTRVTVKNFAFKTTNNAQFTQATLDIPDLGKEIPLSDVPEWKDLKPQITIDNVNKLLIGYFKMPDANTVDPKSPLGVSGFSRAVSNIKQADLQYSRLLWEYEAGEMAIDIDRDALQYMTDESGKTYEKPSILQERLFRKIDLGESDTYQPYNPTLRDSSFTAGLNTILMRIEDQCSLSRGTLSDPATEARTATELKILKQRTYIANFYVQQAIQKALEDVVYAMDVYCSLYDVNGDVENEADVNTVNGIGQYDVSFEWDDSIITDVNEEMNKKLTLMQNGLYSKVEMRMWYFGETESQAVEALQKIQADALAQQSEQMMMEQKYGNA